MGVYMLAQRAETYDRGDAVAVCCCADLITGMLCSSPSKRVSAGTAVPFRKASSFACTATRHCCSIRSWAYLPRRTFQLMFCNINGLWPLTLSCSLHNPGLSTVTSTHASDGRWLLRAYVIIPRTLSHPPPLADAPLDVQVSHSKRYPTRNKPS